MLVFYFRENQFGFMFGEDYCSGAPLAHILKLEAAGQENQPVVQSHDELTIGLFLIDVISNAEPVIGVKLMVTPLNFT